jgi:hypothetical protein
VPRCVTIYNYIQYTGNNKAAILAFVAAGTTENVVSITEAPNGLWLIGSDVGAKSLSPNEFVVCQQGGGISSMQAHAPVEFGNLYIDLPDGVSTAMSGSTVFNTAVSTAAVSAVRAFGGTKAVGIPAAVSLTAGTRSVAVTWPRALPSSWATGGVGNYDVDINPDVGLLAGPYTYAVSAKTLTGCTLSYTNASLVAALAAGTVDLTASK